MKRWTAPAAALAFLVGLAAPAAATVLTSNWVTVNENPGTNCTIGHTVLNNDTGNTGSTVRSKTYCSETAPDANLPADRMGVLTVGKDGNGYTCATNTGWVDNLASTASRSVTATVYCTGQQVWGYGWQRRKVNSVDYAIELQSQGPLTF